MRRLWTGLAVIYALVAIAAFGHSAANARAPVVRCPPDAIYCSQPDKRMETIAQALVAGAFWPLYFSWVAAG